MPCCDSVENPCPPGGDSKPPTNQPEKPTNGSSGDPGGPGGDPGGDPGQPGECDPINDPINCPQPEVDGGGGLAFVQEGGGPIAESPGMASLTRCAPDACDPGKPDDPICCPDEKTGGENEGQPECTKCKTCHAPDAPCCSKWICIINVELCQSKVVASNENLPSGRWFLLEEYDSKNAAEIRCREWQESMDAKGCKTEKDEPKGFDFNQCSEELLKNLTRFMSDEDAFPEAWASFFFGKDGCDQASILEKLESGVSPTKRLELLWEQLVCKGVETIGGFISNVAQFILPKALLNTVDMLPSIQFEAVVGFLSQWIAPGLSRFSNPITQSLNHRFPTAMPSPAQGAQAWRHGFASFEQAVDWGGFAGQCPDQFQQWLLSQQGFMSPGELMIAERRGIISLDEYRTRHRQSGFPDLQTAEIRRELGKVIPGPSSLVRYMQRDVFDPAIVDTFGLHDEFENKFQGKVVEWAKQEGVSVEQMLAEWASHWSIPGPHTLLEFFHRFRKLPESDPRYVSIDMVKDALEQQDILPFWVDKYIAASFRPLTRVDTRRAFEVGSLDEQGLRDNLQAQGYSDDNIDALLRFFIKLKNDKIYGERAAKAYESGILTKDEATDELKTEGYDDETIDRVTKWIDKKLDHDARKTCTNALHKRFLEGEFEKAEIADELGKLGWDAKHAQAIAEKWECERLSQGKMAPISVIKQLVEFRIITPLEAVERIRRLGFTLDAALEIMLAFGLKQAEAAEKEFNREFNKLKRAHKNEVNRLQRLQERKERSRRQASQKGNKDAERAVKAVEKLAIESRAYAEQTGDDFEAIHGRARSLLDQITKEAKLPTPTAVNLIVQAFKQSIKFDDPDWATAALELARAVVSD